ncbi:peptidylprolyl isomerase [Mucilaginibacter sp. CSA2-8R]|uniref:peptidylprolyl isomerase n=1 Tax=Mucilaginibacter sp. CSA2-8R TaxID=3141542 RepID=UPI00315D9AE5
MKKLLLVCLLFVVLSAGAKPPKNQYVCIKTSYGQCIIRLYNQTPKHRDNFVKLIKQGIYNGTLFHRVIQNFMIQGGDPTSKDAKPGVELGNGGLKYTIPAEINDSLFHKRGALGAARDDNPAKASSSTQFYIVEGKRFTDGKLDTLEQTRLKGYKIPQWQRQYYKTIGGAPHLDHNYTVFGEVVSGIDMVELIAPVEKDKRDRPIADVAMTIEVLSKRQSKQLDKLLNIK